MFKLQGAAPAPSTAAASKSAASPPTPRATRDGPSSEPVAREREDLALLLEAHAISQEEYDAHIEGLEARTTRAARSGGGRSARSMIRVADAEGAPPLRTAAPTLREQIADADSMIASLVSNARAEEDAAAAEEFSAARLEAELDADFDVLGSSHLM